MKRWCLDHEWEKNKFTKEYIEGIRKRLSDKYEIELDHMVEDEEWLDIFEQKVADDCHLCRSNEKSRYYLEYSAKNHTVYPKMKMLCIGNVIAQDEEVEKNENIEGMNILELYKILATEEKEKIEWVNPWNYYIRDQENTFEQWVQLLENLVRQGKDFFFDYEIEAFLFVQYARYESKKYQYERSEKNLMGVYGRLNSKEAFPFSKFYSWLQDLQDILVLQRYNRLFEFEIFAKEARDFPENDELREDVTRYSYSYIEDIYEKIQDSEVQNLYYLDFMLGVSLTNIIFNCVVYGDNEKYVKKYNKERYVKLTENEPFWKLVRLFGKMRGIYKRNTIAQAVFCFLYQYNFESNMIWRVYHYLNKNMDRFNQFYCDVRDAVFWREFHDCKFRKDSRPYKNKLKSYIIAEDFWHRSKIQKALLNDRIKLTIGNCNYSKKINCASPGW